jgi:hypothetical protein
VNGYTFCLWCCALGLVPNHALYSSYIAAGANPASIGVSSNGSYLPSNAVKAPPQVPAKHAQHQDSPSIYISNLPKDITEEELEILFGALGRVKKVKIYLNSFGQKKGDALLTFVQTETASTACSKVRTNCSSTIELFGVSKTI